MSPVGAPTLLVNGTPDPTGRPVKCLRDRADTDPVAWVPSGRAPALAGIAGRSSTVLRAGGPAVALAAWLAARRPVAVPPGVGSVAAGGCQLLAWGLVAGVIGSALSRATGREAIGGAGTLGVVGYGTWQHRLPSWFASGAVERLTALPLAGSVRPPSDVIPAAALTGWTATWAVTDLLMVLLIAAVVRRSVGPPPLPARDPVGGVHLTAAVLCAAASALLMASLSGPVEGTSATVQAALAFCAAAAPPVLAATVLGVGAAGRRPDPRAVSALAAALGLDAVAGLLGERDPFGGPQHLVAPLSWTGEWPTASTVLARTAVTTAVCGCLLAVGPLARALRTVAERPGLAVSLAVAADTVDAAATAIGLRNGTVIEANPVVRSTGVTVKWAAVTVLLLLLYRVRPRLVWTVTAVYLLVVAYHVLGSLLLT